jgi:hypothetical protein
MSGKADQLERAILELGSEIFRVKHRMDEVEKSNHTYKQVFLSLKIMLDEKGIISADDFDEAIALDRILNLQSASQNDLMSSLSDDLKKVVN